MGCAGPRLTSDHRGPDSLPLILPRPGVRRRYARGDRDRQRPHRLSEHAHPLRQPEKRPPVHGGTGQPAQQPSSTAAATIATGARHATGAPGTREITKIGHTAINSAPTAVAATCTGTGTAREAGGNTVNTNPHKPATASVIRAGIRSIRNPTAVTT